MRKYLNVSLSPASLFFLRKALPKIGGNFVTICYVFVGQTSAGDGCGNAPRKDQENQPTEYLDGQNLVK